ncbi:MAG: TonB-dependent receptor [Muribaculaceae bacterium]|nr:TonB-dependent receptor [Muribaculaceae bacterium]
MKLKLFLLMLLASTLAMTAQTTKLSGVVVNGSSGAPVGGVTVEINGQKAVTDFNGNFVLEGLNGNSAYMVVTGPSMQSFGMDVKLDGTNLNVGEIRLTPVADNLVDEYFAANDELMFDEAALDDEEAVSQGVSSLNGSNDNIYYSTASYNFGPMYFNYRGLDSQYQSVYINGLKMNDLIRGRFNFNSLLGMSSRAFRNRTSTVGLGASTYAYGDIAGSTNYNTTTDLYAPGFSGSVAFTNSNYMLRALATYSSGLNKHGWAYTVSAIARYAKEGVQPGTFYNSGGLFLSLEKLINDNNRLTLTAFGGPTQRATGGATYQEVYDLTGDNLYNPFWGWQDGKKRSSRITETYDPTAILNWLYKKGNTTLSTAAGVRYSHYTRSALQYFKAVDPNPTYYRYLPSYFLEDGKPTAQSEFYTNLWKTDDSFRQIDWDNLYRVNYLNNAENEAQHLTGNNRLGSSYILENRTNNQLNILFNSTLNTKLSKAIAMQAGVDFNYTRSSNYKTIRDLLGGEFWVDVDPFSDRDITLAPDNLVNNFNYADPYHHEVRKGDKFGYDYDLVATQAAFWAQNVVTLPRVDFNYGFKVEYTSFYRDGKMDNGRARGTGDNGSFGKSSSHGFFTGSAKVGATFKIDGRNQFQVQAEYGSRAPLVENSFIAPRVKNTAVSGLEAQRDLSADASYIWNYRRFRGIITGYYYQVDHAMERTGFYDETYNTYAIFALQGVKRVYKGIELGMAYKLTPSLTATFAGTYARFQYKNNPMGTRSFENGLNPDVTQRVYLKNYFVGSTPQGQANLGLDWAAPKNWYFGINGTYQGDAYVNLSPAYHESLPGLVTMYPDQAELEQVIKEFAGQDKLHGQFTLNLSIGKALYLRNGMSLNFNLNVNNVLNNQNVITYAYQQGRVDTKNYNPKAYPNRYQYAQGIRAFLNVGVRF